MEQMCFLSVNLLSVDGKSFFFFFSSLTEAKHSSVMLDIVRGLLCYQLLACIIVVSFFHNYSESSPFCCF